MNAHSRAGNLQTTRFLYHNGHTHTVAAPLPLLPPPCYHPPASPKGALAVASCAPHVHQPPQPSTVGPDSCHSPMLLSFAAYTLRCRSNGGGRP